MLRNALMLQPSPNVETHTHDKALIVDHILGYFSVRFKNNRVTGFNPPNGFHGPDWAVPQLGEGCCWVDKRGPGPWLPLTPGSGTAGHNSDGKFIARAQRIEYDCELVPRRVAIFIEKTKDGQILPVPNVVVRDVACGANHTLVLDSQKRVFSWGFGGYGRLGHAEQKDEMVPRLVKLFDFPGRGASQIYAGYTCSFAVSEVGGLFFWGATNTSRESTMYPKAVQDLCGWRIRSLACGKSSIIVAADESTISWGPSPTFGELGYGDHKPKSSTAAQEVKTLDGVFTEQVAMGYSHSLVIARDESETEKEKIKKLPEYNPRTL
ncbi:regulator of chromosome condensation 2 [Phyllostomus discolor]|uniref:Regulator of chromosome condensation 2 n=1 Tax=Phyllostomus discolor TaxID=89673 RepID=A0A834AHD1_9CHIR|nr:regulator of chromosome condensation 2 [Phyllostomus discolor]